jgi:diguanylate cyclase (GGDEF)-like protein/PAS domain S-box-containing protein
MKASAPCGARSRAHLSKEVSTSGFAMLHGWYDHRLLILSVAIAGSTAFAAIVFAARRSGLRRPFWLASHARQAHDLRKEPMSPASFRAIAHAIPAVLWTARPDGFVDFISDHLYSYSGLSREQGQGWGWASALHPDDVPLCMERWKHCVAIGESYEIEYRLRASDGTYRWFLARGNPVRSDGGRIVAWIGTCTDIEDQKHHLQILEEQVKQRTEELAEANARLQAEMIERDYARHELDLQNEKMVQELTARSQRATLLAQMGELLQSCLSKDEVFAAALGFAPKIFPAFRGAIALLNPGRSLAEVIGSWADCKLPAPVFEPTACWALRTGRQHLVVKDDPTARCAHAAGVNQTYFCIPILAQGESLGILHFQTTEEHPSVDASELSFKNTFAGQLGLSIANIRLRDALRAQSIKDTLTGLYNRRYLEEMLEREIRRAVRAEQSLGILMLDLDHFKAFNDTYGHEAGDAVLRAAGSFLVNSVRAEDIVCRFGGEEFVVILPTANLASAHSRAERIRSKLRDLTVLHQGQSLGMITVSIGVASLPLHGTSGKDLLAAADAAGFAARRAEAAARGRCRGLGHGFASTFRPPDRGWRRRQSRAATRRNAG